MKINGWPISPEQEQAALDVMVGDFDFIEIIRAFRSVQFIGNRTVEDRAADRLLQREKRRGNVKYIKELRKWRKI